MVLKLKCLMFMYDRINWNTQLKGLYFFSDNWSITLLMQTVLNMGDQFWESLLTDLMIPDGFYGKSSKLSAGGVFWFRYVTAGQGAATHSGTHWWILRWLWPRACPGRKGDISGNRPRLCGAGRCSAASPAPPQSTRWRGHCTYTWRRQRNEPWLTSAQTH